MNEYFRKVALGAAALGLLLSLFIALRPGDDEEPPAKPSVPAATETEPTAPTVEPLPAPAAVTIRIVVPSDAAPTVRRYSVEQQQQVVVVVTAELSDTVHLHGYDLKAEVRPGRPAKISFTADAPGRFELELEERGLEIAELEVRP